MRKLILGLVLLLFLVFFGFLHFFFIADENNIRSMVIGKLYRIMDFNVNK